MNYPKIQLSKKQQESINNFFINNSKLMYQKILCKNCSSSDHKILFKNDRYGININLVICNNCGLMFTNPQLTEDSINNLYHSDKYRELLHGDAKHELNNIDINTPPPIKFINSLDIKYESVCDVGCGPGAVLKYFQLAKKKVTGYEPSHIYSNSGIKKKSNVIRGFINDVKGQFDLVTLIHVLEHLVDPIKSIKRIRENTKKYLFIEVPASITKFQSFQFSHLYYFSPNTLVQIVTKCGFKLIHMKYKVQNVNDYIYALFEKSATEKIYYYSYNTEVRKFKNIYYKFFLKNLIKKFIKKILDFINPEFKKKIKIIDFRTLGSD
jgi:SAM-dependent methyltransferase